MRSAVFTTASLPDTVARSNWATVSHASWDRSSGAVKLEARASEERTACDVFVWSS
ncbi:hypothetical protein COSO111634_29150 [Corallococcus soli]